VESEALEPPDLPRSVTPYEGVDRLETRDLPAGLAREPVAVEPGTSLRDEVTRIDPETGELSRNVLAAVNEWR
jgi:hypothetical protein